MAALDDATREELMQDNRIGLNLAELGDPGSTFSSDTFLPGSMMTFEQSITDTLDRSLVANAAAGLVMNVMHQEGTIPDVVAEFQTGGETFEVNQEISAMTDAERAVVDAARKEAEAELQARGIDPRSPEGMEHVRSATDAAMPERFKSQTFKFTAPERTYSQRVGPIETNISSNNLTVAGVDTSKTDIGLILPDQITSGTWFTGADQVIANASYEDKQSLAVGGTIELGGKTLTLTGIVEPELYTTTADLYLPLADLQTLADRTETINILLIKVADAQSVETASRQLENLFVGAAVTDATDTAHLVTGSLVNAANLTNKFIGVTSFIIIGAAFVIVSLLTILSVNKRVREIGTLKAIGWSNTRIIRQIIGENVILGMAGGALGIGLGLGMIALLNTYDISLAATITGNEPQGMVGMAQRFFGGLTSEGSTADTTTTVTLHVAYTYLILLLGAGVALIGSIIAGALAAVKASKMKPQEAFRNLE